MRALLSIEKYFKMCQHEHERPANPELITDVYDGTAWKEFMGECVYPNNRLGLLGCGDGIPAFAAGTLSLVPWMWMNMSLPPAARVKAKYMILFMLFQSSVKHEKQRKYFDFAAKYELNDLVTTGIDGVRSKSLVVQRWTPEVVKSYQVRVFYLRFLFNCVEKFVLFCFVC